MTGTDVARRGSQDGAERRVGPRWPAGRWHRQATPADQPAGAFAERLTERWRAERRLRWHRVVVAVAVLAVVGAVAWALLVSPLLALDAEHVTVTGTGQGTTVATSDVTAVVDRHAGTPLPRLDAPGLRDEIAALPTVRGVQVHRSWPRGLRVEVVPREPVAAWQTEGRVELLDGDGVTVAVADEVPEGMARVDVPRSGDRAADALRAVLTVLAELPEGMRAEVVVAAATSPAAITLELDDGAEVRWGSAAESELKAAVLDVLRSQPAAVYDVTVPRSPTTSD